MSYYREITLFPNDQIATSEWALMKSDYFDRWKRSGKSIAKIVPYVVGCIDYQSVDSDKRHHTAIIYQVLKRASNQNGDNSAFDINDIPVQANDIVLQFDWATGNGPAD